MSEKILVAKDITKSFGHFQVLNGINLTIERGDRYILFGSNGAGKTTLVKILSTILPADSGELTLFGKKIERRSKDIKTMIGFMSHEPYLYNELSAWENLNFYASLYSVKDKKERVESLLKEVGLYHRSHDRIGSFSRGMKQRLSLARAILHAPDIIFLDEPYAGLDIRAQEILNDLIIRLNQKGKTFFFITHDIGKGFEIANRSGVLSRANSV
ncbi:ABC-type multidrug transport system, ATPase component [Thermoplasmatales archaeon SCGC AB-540-F20]|nr:ABC-type multidrug transport system, ATPase component [Thermoplasmatales archaeon SCGC AB-540-F20]